MQSDSASATPERLTHRLFPAPHQIFGRTMAAARLLLAFALLASTCDAFGGHHIDAEFGIKKYHEWTFEEFVEHKELGKHPKGFTGEWAKMHPESAKIHGMDHIFHPEVELQDHHHEFKAKPEEEKKAAYEQWIKDHTELEDKRKRESTMKYQMYYAFFHWRAGIVGLTFFTLKTLAIVWGCYCLCRHKRARQFVEQPGSPFRAKPPKKHHD